jgi:hypothetical protein
MDELTKQVTLAAERAEAMCESRSGEVLDYSEASLAVVEDMLAEAARFAADMAAKQVSLLTEDFGCYILEVGRREFGGRYAWLDQRGQPVLVVGEPAFRVALLAWDKVQGRLSGDEADNVPFFYAGFAERARLAKPGTDVLYV